MNAEITDKLTHIRQQLETVDSASKLEDVYQELDFLSRLSPSEEVQASVAALWQQAQQLESRATNAIGMAADALTIATAERIARQEIAGEYDRLVDAVEGRDRDHDMIGDLIDEVTWDHEEYVLGMQLEETHARLRHAISPNNEPLPREIGEAMARFYNWLVEPEDEPFALSAYQRQLLRDLVLSFIPDEAYADE